MNNFRNKITRLEEELDSIENNDICEYDQLCETLSMDLKPNIYDIEYLHEEMKKLEKSGIDGLYIEFEECEKKIMMVGLIITLRLESMETKNTLKKS